jgi:DNA-binding transcriptional ArsR family regulator
MLFYIDRHQYINKMTIIQTISEDEVTLMHRYICEGIGDTKRLRLLYLVAERPRNVTELTELLDVTQPTVSHHLRVLRERGLVNAERDGTSIYYSLGDPRILEAMNILRSFVADLLAEKANVLDNTPGAE